MEVELRKEEETEPNRELLLNYDKGLTFYLNTNWEKYESSIKGTNKFYGILKKYGSSFFDIKSLSYNFRQEEPYYESIRVFENEVGAVSSFKFKDNSINYYRKFIRNEKGEFDDVINIKLPYDSSMTLEEVREAYIRDYVEK